MAADGDPFALRALHRHGRVPADPRAVSALQRLVTWELWLVLGRNRVHVIGDWNHGNAEVALPRPLKKAEHNVSSALVSLSVYDRIERFAPFGGLLGVAVNVML